MPRGWKTHGSWLPVFISCLPRHLFTLHWTVYSKVVNCIEVCVCIRWSHWTSRRTLKYLKIISTQWDASLSTLQVCTYTHTGSCLFSSPAPNVWTVCGLWCNWGDLVITQTPENTIFPCLCTSVLLSLSHPRRGSNCKCSHGSRTQETDIYQNTQTSPHECSTQSRI